MNARSGLWLALLGLVAIVSVPLLLSGFYVNLLSYVGIYSLVTLGVVLLTGAGGLISFGQAAFMGVGAYSTAVVSANFGLSLRNSVVRPCTASAPGSLSRSGLI